MKKVKFGIIGAANIANRFCNAVKMVENAEVIAVASKTVGKAEIFAKNNNLPIYYTDYKDLLINPDIDIVYISTTHNFHYDNIIEAFNYGKAVLCEKCFVLSYGQASHVFSVAKEKNLFVMEAMWSRFLPAYTKVKEWIHNGEIGELSLINASIGFKAPNDLANRIINPKLAGGAMFDIGVYAVEIVTYLIGEEVNEIKAMISNGKNDVDMVDMISLRFDSCLAHLQCFLNSRGGRDGICIYGSEGYIHVPNMCGATEAFLYKENKEPIIFSEPCEDAFIYEIQEVVKCINEGKIESDIMPYSATLQCAEIFDICLNTVIE